MKNLQSQWFTPDRGWSSWKQHFIMGSITTKVLCYETLVQMSQHMSAGCGHWPALNTACNGSRWFHSMRAVAGSGQLCVCERTPWGQGRLFSLLEARGVSAACCIWQHGKAKKLYCVTSLYVFSQSFSNECNIGCSRFTPMWSSCPHKCFLLPRSTHSILLNSLRSF